MARWIALLRGVNISGRNKVAMSEWKVGLGAGLCQYRDAAKQRQRGI